jgi:hypothetical protein
MRHTLILALSLLAGTARAEDLSTYTAWFDKYSRCELHLAARTWGVDENAASERLKELATAGEGAQIDAAVDAARQKTTATGWEVCDYHEAGFSYDDAEALAAFWGLSDAAEAKARIEHKLMYRYEADLASELKAAHNGGANVYDAMADQQRQVFFAAGLDWCDAEVLAAVWGTDFDTAKIATAKLIESGDKSWKKALKKGRKVHAPAVCGG